MTTAFVTGGTGFIGQHLVRRLIEEGVEVRCLVRPTSNVAPLKALGAELCPGDMTDRSSLAHAAEGADWVFHLAAMLKAPWRKAFLTDNLAGTRNVAEACCNAQTPPVLVSVSSMAAVGPTRSGTPKSEAEPPAPVSRYGRVKLACDDALAGYADRLPTTIVRPPIVFGEGDWTVLKLLKTVSKGWHVVPTWRGNAVSMIHARDLADLLIAAARRGERIGPGGPLGQGIYFSADRHQPAYADLGRLVGEAFGRSTRILRVPGPVMWLIAAASELGARRRDKPTFLTLDKYREATGGSWICDVSKAETQLSWAPAEAPLQRFRQTIQWFRERGELP